MSIKNSARVHYWELSNYNNGKLIGKWFDLEYLSHDEHLEEIRAWLEELSEETGELCEEIILGDTEDVPDCFVSEWSISADFFEYQEVVGNSSLDAEVFEAAMSVGIALERVEDSYYGEFESDEEMARELVESCYDLEKMRGSLVSYFDYEAFARDLMMDYSKSGNYYFRP